MLIKKKLTSPISFEEFDRLYKEKCEIPGFIYEAVNQLLLNNWDGDKAVFKQSEIIKTIKSVSIPEEYQNIPYEEFHNMIFHYRWLDIEESYREKGWDVKYDKPGYNEDYAPFFTFKKKG